jgi:hypothetical protein
MYQLPVHLVDHDCCAAYFVACSVFRCCVYYYCWLIVHHSKICLSEVTIVFVSRMDVLALAFSSHVG